MHDMNQTPIGNECLKTCLRHSFPIGVCLTSCIGQDSCHMYTHAHTHKRQMTDRQKRLKDRQTDRQINRLKDRYRYKQTDGEIDSQTHKHARTRARAHARAHARTRARTHARTHTRMHTHTRPPPPHTHTFIHALISKHKMRCGFHISIYTLGQTRKQPAPLFCIVSKMTTPKSP